MLRGGAGVLVFLSSWVAGCGPLRETRPRPASEECPPHATLRQGRCACDAGVVLAGACVPWTVAERLCDGDFDGAACVPARCEAGEISLSRGVCVPQGGLRASASHPWVVPEPGGTLACSAGSTARARRGAAGPALLCLPSSACFAGESWSAGRCVRDDSCAPGHVFDARRGCVSVVAPDDHGGRADVPAWVAGVIGADGGAGSSLLCGAIRQNPQVGGVLDRAVVAELTVTVTAPGSDLAGAEVLVRATPAEITPLTTEVSGVLTDALRSLGATASATRARAVVRCTVGGALVPETMAAGQKL